MKKFEDFKDSPEKTWSYAKTLMDIKCKSSPSQLVNSKNEILRITSHIAGEINKFFMIKLKL